MYGTIQRKKNKKYNNFRTKSILKISVNISENSHRKTETRPTIR